MVDKTQRQRREEQLFWPYHHAITRALDARTATPPLFIAIHSFTPQMRGGYFVERRSPDSAHPHQHAALRRLGLTVGDNEPYSTHMPDGFTVVPHAGPRGLPHVIIEVRQDHLANEAGIAKWCDILFQSLTAFVPLRNTS